jgi:hypothetical protein
MPPRSLFVDLIRQCERDGPEFARSIPMRRTGIDWRIWNFKSNCGIRFSRQDKILVFGIRWPLHLLFKRRHEAISWLQGLKNFRILNFKRQTASCVIKITTLVDLIGRTTNAESLIGYMRGRSRHDRSAAIQLGLFFGQFLLMCSSRQALLMFLPLGVRQIIRFVPMHRTAEFAFKGSHMIACEVRIFGQIDGFQRQLFQSFFAFALCLRCRTYTATAKLGAHAILTVHFNKNGTKTKGTEVGFDRRCFVRRY